MPQAPTTSISGYPVASSRARRRLRRRNVTPGSTTTHPASATCIRSAVGTPWMALGIAGVLMAFLLVGIPSSSEIGFLTPRLAIGYSSGANPGAGCLITTETGFFILASDGYGRQRDHSRTRERGISAARRRRHGDR